MTQKHILYSENNIYIFECPHCNLIIQVKKSEINCKIFRHAVLKSSGQQINPHSPKNYCDELIKNNLVYGCAKPFRIKVDNNNNPLYIESCAYI